MALAVSALGVAAVGFVALVQKRQQIPTDRVRIDWSLLLTFGNDEIIGGWTAIGTTLIVFVIALAAHVHSRSYVSVYRDYEEVLVKEGRIGLNDVLRYHSQYRWGSYAALAIAAVFITVSIIVMKETPLEPEQRLLIGSATLIMAISAIALAYIDLMHTNSQTPLIPISKRFQLINISVVVGAFGTMLMFTSMIMFLALLDLMLTVISSLFLLILASYVTYVRIIDPADLRAYFKYHGDSQWKETQERLERLTELPDIPYQRVTREHEAIYVRLLCAVKGLATEFSKKQEFLQNIRTLLDISDSEHELITRRLDQDHVFQDALACMPDLDRSNQLFHKAMVDVAATIGAQYAVPGDASKEPPGAE